MAENLPAQIMDVLAGAEGGPLPVREVARILGIVQDQMEHFRQVLERLISIEHIVSANKGRRVSLPVADDLCTGIFHGTGRGFGFVVPLRQDPRGDLFIAAADTMDALTGDLVVARLSAMSRRESARRSRTARIIRILRRGVNRCVGTVQRQLKNWVVVPDGATFKQPVQVQDITAKNAAIGDKVLVELIQYPRAGQPAEGVITEVLGPGGEPEVELESVICQFDLPRRFPDEVLEQARRAAADFHPQECRNREDLSGTPTITIDPDDARDFDDAISLRILKESENSDAAMDRSPLSVPTDGAGPAVYELGVHIADVASFVPVETSMDMEARRRGNSVYFPRHVVPMLPEVLSNGVCSLQEGHPRLTKSAFIRYDRHGRVVSSRVANTIICSHRRLTYRQAQAIIDDAKGQGAPYSKGLLDSPPNPNVPEVSSEIRELLVNMDRLAGAIQQRRRAQGMISLDLPEVELVMDPLGHVIDARRQDDSYTHKIIEMFMVEANEAVARVLTHKGLNVLRRIHPDPDTQAAEKVRQFVSVTGRRLPRQLDRHVLQELLDSVRGTPIAYAVHLSVLKTFSTAEYSPLPLGHYALASENYAHFTSPIRRYADLVIHRCLQGVLAGPVRRKGPSGDPSASTGSAHSDRRKHGGSSPEVFALMPRRLGDMPDYDTLLRLGRHLSFTERRAQDAERELRTVKVLQLLAEHTGDIIDGVVTGVNNFGVFVQSTRFLVEGLIRTGDLPNDCWVFDERTGSLRGRRSGRRISLGDAARVQIVCVNVPARRMDLRLLEHGSTIRGEHTLRRMEPAGRPPTPAGHGAVAPRGTSQQRRSGRRLKEYNGKGKKHGRHSRRGRS